MGTYLSETREIVDQGKFEQALERYIWFHEHILEAEPSQYGVRLSFALSHWKYLGDLYPPAMEALIETRDQKVQRFREGNFGDEELFADLVAINRVFDEHTRSIALFEELEQFDNSLATKYWPFAKEAAIDLERYDLLKSYEMDFEEEFAQIVRVFRSKMDFYEDPEIGGESLKRRNEEHLANKTLELLAISLKLNNFEAARDIQQKALDLVSLDSVKKKLRALHIMGSG